MTQPLSEPAQEPEQQEPVIRDDLDRMLDELNQEPPDSPAVLAFNEAQAREDQAVVK